MKNTFAPFKRLSAFARIALIIASASLGNAPFAMAGDAAARRVIGFSPSGSHFAFEQYTTLYDSLDNIVRIEVIDTAHDAYVKGTPVTMKNNEDDGHDLPELRNEAMRKARLITDPLLIHDVGTHFPGKPSMELDEIGIYQMDPKPLATSQEIILPDGRKLTLAIADKALGKASCYGAGGRGTYGDVIVTGMTLTLAIDGAPMVLNDDSRLPKNRRCVTAYGIAEVYHHQASDGAQTLAVLIETVDTHEFHAGPNRRFMAVTRRLP